MIKSDINFSLTSLFPTYLDRYDIQDCLQSNETLNSLFTYWKDIDFIDTEFEPLFDEFYFLL